MGETGKKPSKRRKKRTALVSMIVLAIMLFSVITIWYFKRDLAITKENNIPNQGSLLPPGFAADGPLSDMTENEIREQMQKIADASYFAFKINARPVFETGDGKGNVRIENPSYNVYPMVVQIVLDETEEILFDSGGIFPNQHIDSASLNRPLPPGSYNATAYMNAYDPDSHTWLGKQAAALVITVNG